MSDYIRSTQSVTVSTLPPALAAALRAQAAKQGIADLDTAARACARTTNRKPKQGLFGKEEVSENAVVVTPQWLLWATSVNGQAPVVLSARLRDITIEDYGQSSFNKLVPDSGLNINGLPSENGSIGTAFIGLGPEPAAAQLRAALDEAQAAAG